LWGKRFFQSKIDQEKAKFPQIGEGGVTPDIPSCSSAANAGFWLDEIVFVAI